MKVKLITFFTIALFWAAAALLPSCGKKDEATTINPDTTKTTQQQTTQTTEKKDSATADAKKKEEDRKKEEDKKKEEEKKKKEEEAKKKKEEEAKKKEEDAKKQDVSGIDFAPIWSKKCAKCHGKDGTGKVEGVPNLTVPPTVDKSFGKLVETITNGKKGKTEDDEDMPSFRGKLTEEEINAAAKYVQKLGGY